MIFLRKTKGDCNEFKPIVNLYNSMCRFNWMSQSEDKRSEFSFLSVLKMLTTIEYRAKLYWDEL